MKLTAINPLSLTTKRYGSKALCAGGTEVRSIRRESDLSGYRRANDLLDMPGFGESQRELQVVVEFGDTSSWR
jgi:hypothetical protein